MFFREKPTQFTYAAWFSVLISRLNRYICMRDAKKVTSLLSYALVVFLGGLNHTYAQTGIEVLSPTNGQCLNEYSGDARFEGGILNGNIQGSQEVAVDVRITDDQTEQLTLYLNYGPVQESYAQAESLSCEVSFTATFEERIAACNGQGYCIFSGICVCTGDADCNGGQGVCRDDSTCGCSNDDQCGLGEVCNAEGNCECGDDQACGAGFECRNSGACSCNEDADCGGDLFCSNGACSSFAEYDTAIVDVPPRDFGDVSTRVLDVTGYLPSEIEDAENVNLEVLLVDPNATPIATLARQSVSFTLDRTFPQLNTLDFCVEDADCGVPGEGCDPVLQRCFPLNQISNSSCRDAEDFSQGLPIEYQLIDNLDPNPSFQLLAPEVNGCNTHQKILVSDACGNEQVVNIITQRAPLPEEIQANYEAFRCFSTPCETEFLPARLRSTRYIDEVLGTVNDGPYDLSSVTTLNIEVEDTNGTLNESISFQANQFNNQSAATASEVAGVINAQSNQVKAIDDAGSLIIETNELGEDMVLRVTGDAATPLGFAIDEPHNIFNQEARGFSPAILNEGDSAARVNLQLRFTGNEGCYDVVERTIADVDAQGNIVANSSRNLVSDEILEALPASLLSTRIINGQVLHGGPFVSIPASLISTRSVNGNVTYSGPYTLSQNETLNIDVNGTVESITFNAADFNNIAQASAAEVVTVINRESSLIEALVQSNGILIQTLELDGEPALGSHIQLTLAGSASTSLGFADDVANNISNSQAQGKGLFDGATLEFTINGNINETITFRKNNFFDLYNARTVEVVAQINSQSAEINAFLDDTALRIETKRLGKEVSVQVDGTAAESLGFIDDEASGIENAGATGSGDGDFQASFAVYACNDNNPILEDSFDISVSADLTFDVGGPYFADQGEDLTITALTLIPLEFGGIKRIEWDTNGDGSYDAEEPSFEFEEPVASLSNSLDDASQILFDTSEDGEFFISCRVTTGQDTSLEVSTAVTIYDITPVCNLPQDRYIAREGEPIIIEATADSGAINESDPIVEYRWNFGDCEDPDNNPEECQQSTLDPSIQHIYRSQGEYTIEFTAFDIDSSCPQSATAIVEVLGVAPIIEDIGIDNPLESFQEGDTLLFTKGNTRAGSESDLIVAYAWELTHLNTNQSYNSDTDDTFSTESPEFTFNDDGDYRMCLTVADTDDQVGPVCFEFTIEDLEPRPVWNVPDGVLQKTEGSEFLFDATGTVAGGDSDQLTGLRWEFSDPARPGNPNSNVIFVGDLEQLQIPPYIFNGDGTFTVRLTAIDEDSESYYEGQVTILDVNPTARFTVIYPEDTLIGLENQALTLDASESVPGADTDLIREYHWDFGDGSTDITPGPITTHAWPDGPALYEVTLTVYDQDSSTATSLNLDIANVDPVVSISATSPSVEVGAEARFMISVDDVVLDRPGTADNEVTIEWDMGDGTLYSGEDQVSHTFQQEGQFVITVHYVDGDGGEGEAEFPYTILPKRAEIDPAQVTVELRTGEEVVNPTTPIGDFVEDEADGETFYIYEGDEITINSTVRSARLSNGTLDPANAVWELYPDGAEPSYIPVLPADGDEAGSEEKIARLTWKPTYFQAGTYIVRLLATGEVTEGESSRQWRIRVSEGGSPMLAGTAGSLRRGRVVLYEYGKENDRLTFTPNREIDIGQGAYKIVPHPSLPRLFVSAPGSGHVAVLDGDPMRVIRFIPTGAGAYDMAWGNGYLWVVNVLERTLSIIDPNTLKVTRTVNFTDRNITSILWAGTESGLSEGHVILGDGKNGTLYIYNATGLLRGEVETALTQEIILGKSLSQMALFENQLVIGDTKKRLIYHADLVEVINNGTIQSFTIVSDIPFMLQDMQADENSLWMTTGNALYQVRSGFEIQMIDYPAAKIALLPVDALESSGIVISDGSRLDNYTLDESSNLSADPIHGIDGSRVQSLTFYINYITADE